MIRPVKAAATVRRVGRLSQTERSIISAYETGFATIRNTYTTQGLAEALTSMPVGSVVGRFDWGEFGQTVTTRVADALLQQVRRSGTMEAANLTPVLGHTLFNITDPRAVGWSQQYAGRDVVQITDQQMRLVNEVVTRGLTEGIDVRRTAIELRQSIGLHDRYARAVMRQFDNNVATFQSQGLSASDAVDRATVLAEKYRDRLIRSRCSTIARTETIRAANEGRVLSWQQAVEDGLLDPAQSSKEWLAEPDACDICEENANDGLIPLDESFSSGDDQPDAHPNCRCSVVLVPIPAEPREQTPSEPTE